MPDDIAAAIQDQFQEEHLLLEDTTVTTDSSHTDQKIPRDPNETEDR